MLLSILSSFVLVFLAEFGDKSQLVCMLLASHHRQMPVFLGACSAFALLNLVAVSLGSACAQLIPHSTLTLVAALMFFVFALKALFGRVDETPDIEEKSGLNVFLITFLMIFVLALTVLEDLITAVAAGVILACFTFMKKISDVTEDQTLVAGISDNQWVDERTLPPEIREHVFIKHVDGPLFFGFAAGFLRMAEQLSEGKVVIFRLDRVSYIDQTGAYALLQTIDELNGKGVRVIIVGIRGSHLDMMRKLRLIPDLVPESHVFLDFHTLAPLLPDMLKPSREPQAEQAHGQP